MQSASVRLQQAIWTALKAAKPAHTSITRQKLPSTYDSHVRPALIQERHLRQWRSLLYPRIRYYSDGRKSDIDKKVEDAKQRIDDSLDARADKITSLPGPEQDVVKDKQDETIIHTLPESSSIVYNPDRPEQSAAASAAAEPPDTKQQASSHAASASSGFLSSENTPRNEREPLPSQIAARYSHLRGQFTHFMDNFQTHVFTASRRLNDLTGYSSIEQLKRDIEEQEHAVRAARQHVKDSRKAYQDTINTRSDTQREVNDLLHRKHAWSSADLERFTSLYRSDHANEQAEQKAHETLSKSETSYEEASARLSKSILARYHEEQVWSDKIRQMSTWGTWGLMGLNVLLFVVFQIMIEPWRRRRLVRGFEEKVQEALKEQNVENDLRTMFHVKRAQEEAGSEVAAVTEPKAVGVATSIEGADAAVFESAAAEHGPTVTEVAERTHIEQAAETVTTAELRAEGQAATSDLSGKDRSERISTEDSVAEVESKAAVTNLETVDSQDTPNLGTRQGKQNTEPLPTISEAPYQDLPYILGTYVRVYLDRTKNHIESLFNDQTTLTTTRKALTSKMIEGAFYGAAGVVTLFWIVGVGVSRGR